MSIIVTGSSGYVGENLIPKLRVSGYNVIGIDLKPGRYTTMIHDISKPIKIDAKIGAIIHLASKLEHDRANKEEYNLTSVTGTENLLRVAEQHKSYFIYLSTDAIYGTPKSPITEETPVKPEGSYGLAKVEGERVCQKYNNVVDITIIRPTVLVGEKRPGIYRIIFQKLYSNALMPILGNGTNKIAFAHIDDFVDFVIHLINSKPKNLIVNFGGEAPGTLNQVIDELRIHMKSKSKIIHLPIGFRWILMIFSTIRLLPFTKWQLSVMINDHFFDNRQLFETGFRYKHDPIDGLKAMADYYVTNRNRI